MWAALESPRRPHGPMRPTSHAPEGAVPRSRCRKVACRLACTGLNVSEVEGPALERLHMATRSGRKLIRRAPGMKAAKVTASRPPPSLRSSASPAAPVRVVDGVVAAGELGERDDALRLRGAVVVLDERLPAVVHRHAHLRRINTLANSGPPCMHAPTCRLASRRAPAGGTRKDGNSVGASRQPKPARSARAGPIAHSRRVRPRAATAGASSHSSSGCRSSSTWGDRLGQENQEEGGMEAERPCTNVPSPSSPGRRVSAWQSPG